MNYVDTERETNIKDESCIYINKIMYADLIARGGYYVSTGSSEDKCVVWFSRRDCASLWRNTNTMVVLERLVSVRKSIST